MSRKNNCSYQIFTSDFLKVQEIEFHAATFKLVLSYQSDAEKYFNLLKSSDKNQQHSQQEPFLD